MGCRMDFGDLVSTLGSDGMFISGITQTLPHLYMSCIWAYALHPSGIGVGSKSTNLSLSVAVKGFCGHVQAKVGVKSGHT